MDARFGANVCPIVRCKGMVLMQGRGIMSVFVGAVIKNISKSFQHFETFIDEFVRAVPSVVICVYEDNSTDGTDTLLRNLSIRYPYNVHSITEKIDNDVSFVRTWDNKSCRIERIAIARNQLMIMLEARGLGNCDDDLCVMIDPDVPVKILTDRIVHFVRNFPNNTDAIFANGISMMRRGCYYDIFACRNDMFPFDYDILGEEKGAERIRHKSKQVEIPVGEQRVVWSAFGGLAIYKGKCIRGKRYSAFPTADLNYLYRNIIKSHPESDEVQLVKQIQSSVETHKNGSLLGMYLFEPKADEGLFYFNCHGYNYPIVCEHVTFHASMLRDGYSKMYIEPDLIYISDH
jgi:hypothetical protein